MRYKYISTHFVTVFKEQVRTYTYVILGQIANYLAKIQIKISIHMILVILKPD